MLDSSISSSVDSAGTVDAVVAQHHPTPASSRKKPTKAKVLHVINGEHYSGAERVQDLLSHRLPDYGYDVGFACVKPGLFAEKRIHQESPVFETKMKSRLNWRASRQIAQLIQKHDFRIVHAHTPRSALVGGIAARQCNVPFVFHVHSPTSRDSTRWLINWINQRIEKWSIRKADRIVTVSDSLRSHMTSLGFDSQKIIVVPNGVPIQGKRESGKTLETQNREFVIGTVALFRPRKGTEVLLRAVAKLKENRPNVKLLAVGPFETPQYEDQLKSLSRELGLEETVSWTGFTRDVVGQLEKMDAFSLPSLFGEGLPMVVLEAMSYGVPVVASDVEGIPQAIRDEKDGLIVKAGDHLCLAKKLQRLVTDPNLCNSLSRNAYQRQQDHFSDVSMARQLSKVYDDVLAGF